MKTKRIIGLLLAVVMLVAVALPVSANYDPTIRANGGIPRNDWTLVEMNHWVVRGETLEQIAFDYGTTVAEIKLNNAAYFNDLANRNKTTGLNIEVEHGVRLFIYHMVRVVRFVQRGDTLASLSDGSLRVINNLGEEVFRLLTTPEAIIRENQDWFDDLALLNRTRDVNHPLEESYAIYRITHVAFRGYYTLPPTVAGSPLVITVPVQLSSRGPFYNFVRESYAYVANAGEFVGNSQILDFWGQQAHIQVTRENTMPTNVLMPDLRRADGSWARWAGGNAGTVTTRPVNYRIPGLYGSTWWDR